MKSKIIHAQSSKPKTPWADIEYPCLIEREGTLAIATSAKTGIVMVSDEGDIDPYDADGNSTWEKHHWTPVIGSRTIEFSN